MGGGPEKGTKFRVFYRPITVGRNPCDTRWKQFDPESGIKLFPPCVTWVSTYGNWSGENPKFSPFLWPSTHVGLGELKWLLICDLGWKTTPCKMKTYGTNSGISVHFNHNHRGLMHIELSYPCIRHLRLHLLWTHDTTIGTISPKFVGCGFSTQIKH